jgi:16S rRNA processing protein RimM
VHGTVRIKSFTERPEDVASYGPVSDETGRSFALGVVGLARGAVLARVEGIADRTAAEALKGVRLYVDRDKLPEPDDGEFYCEDLVGLRAELADGTEIGTVTSVEDFGAGDIIEIARPGERPLLIAFNDATVPEVDLDQGRIVVVPPDEFGEPEKSA